MAYGVVLAGGGTRGAYQMGVWKALDEFRVPISAIVGVSIGALNGALMVQGDWDLGYRAWHEISIADVVKLPEPLPVPDNVFDRRNLPVLARLVISEKGLDTSPFRKQMARYLDETRLRKASVDYGVLVFSLTDRKPLSLFRDDIPSGQLLDYILASATLPLFRSVQIDGKRLIDGGVYNNRPTEMLIHRGFRNIIEIEVGGIGLARPYKSDGLNVISIKPEKPIGGILDVRKDRIDENIRQGYRDAHRILSDHFPSAGTRS